jgi:SulP family sulfate permease
MPQRLTPKLFTTLKNYNADQFYKDCIAGILVGIIAFPLAIALAVSSGVNPEMGINTAIVAGFIVSFMGGSRVQIGGPTAAFVPIVFNIVNNYGIEGLIIATVMAGILLIIMGFCKLGIVIKYIPYPVITGFTSGIAVSILIKQIKELLGLTLTKTPAETIELITTYIQNLHNIDVPTFTIGITSLLIIFTLVKYAAKFNKYIPPSLIAIIITSFIVYYFDLDSIATVGSVYQDLNTDIFHFSLPTINITMIKNLIEPAFSIAVLAGIESLLSAVIADGMIGSRHRSNAELVAQGVANVCSACCGGIPATGAIARTATNIKNGGRTPIAGIVHAITVLIIMLLCIPLAKMIPLTCLAAILITIAYNMGEWQVFRDIYNAPKSDASVFLATFILTVIFDLTIAIKVGLILAAFLFIRRMADVTEINQLVDFDDDDELTDASMRLNIAKQLGDQALLYEIRGPFFFGAVDKLADTINKINITTKLIILKMHEVPIIDSTGIHSLKTLYKTCQHSGIIIYFTHLRIKPYRLLQKSGFIEMLGEQYFCKNISQALSHYKENYMK